MPDTISLKLIGRKTPATLPTMLRSATRGVGYSKRARNHARSAALAGKSSGVGGTAAAAALVNCNPRAASPSVPLTHNS